MGALRRHWNLLAGLAAGGVVWWLNPGALDGPLRIGLGVLAALLVAQLLGSLQLLLRVLWWLLVETCVRPNPWTIVGGVVGALWCLDAWTRTATRPVTTTELVVAAALGYPLGALAALLPRGAVHGFAALQRLFQPRAPARKNDG